MPPHRACRASNASTAAAPSTSSASYGSSSSHRPGRWNAAARRARATRRRCPCDSVRPHACAIRGRGTRAPHRSSRPAAPRRGCGAGTPATRRPTGPPSGHSRAPGREASSRRRRRDERSCLRTVQTVPPGCAAASSCRARGAADPDDGPGRRREVETGEEWAFAALALQPAHDQRRGGGGRGGGGAQGRILELGGHRSSRVCTVPPL